MILKSNQHPKGQVMEIFKNQFAIQPDQKQLSENPDIETDVHLLGNIPTNYHNNTCTLTITITIVIITLFFAIREDKDSLSSGGLR